MSRLIISLLFVIFISIPINLVAQKRNEVKGAMMTIITTVTKVEKGKKVKPTISEEELARLEAEKKAALEEKQAALEAKKAAREERAKGRKGRFFVSFNLAMPYIKYPQYLSYGFMAGWSGKVLGGYAKGLFGDGIGQTSGTINSQDACLEYLNNDSSVMADASYSAVTAGLLVRMGCPLHLYTGVGASWRRVAYRSAIDSRLYLASDKSATTICIDLGLMLKFKWFNISAGTIYTPKYGFASNLGFGCCF